MPKPNIEISVPLASDYPQTRETNTGLGNTPLITAAVSGDADEIEHILKDYPNHSDYINLQDLGNDTFGRGYENTALILAIMVCHTNIAIRLIDCGAHTTLANNYGTTPLHYACLTRNHVLIELLINKGAKWDSKNDVGVTPLDFYLHDFDGFDEQILVIREIELMLEHHRSNAMYSEKREKAREDILGKTQLLMKQEAIPRLINDKISDIVQKTISPIFSYNHSTRFAGSLISFAYNNYQEFQQAWMNMGATYPNPDMRSQPMLDVIKEILKNKYGVSKTYSFEHDKQTNSKICCSDEGVVGKTELSSKAEKLERYSVDLNIKLSFNGGSSDLLNTSPKAQDQTKKPTCSSDVGVIDKTKLSVKTEELERYSMSLNFKLPSTSNGVSYDLFKTTPEARNPMSNISMMILNGFIAALGIATVIIAFTLLDAVTFGIAGLVIAGTGVVATLAGGYGFFATGINRNNEKNSDESLNKHEAQLGFCP